MHIEDTLYASSNPGRYEVGRNGPDLTTGDVCEVWLGGRWLRATVMHGAGMIAVERPKGSYNGYYLLFEDAFGNVSLCGLCVGMLVRIHG